MLNKLHKNEQGSGLIEALTLIILVGVILAFILPYMINTMGTMENKIETIQQQQQTQAGSTAEVLKQIQEIKKQNNITSTDNAEIEITNQALTAEQIAENFKNNPEAVKQYLKEYERK